jgi:SAM-dependent methyltransferase
MPDKPPVALEDRSEHGDGRRFSPSVARNREPILSALKPRLPQPARLLEVASGTGEHGAFLADRMEGLNWTYSDIDADSLASQRAWQAVDETGRLHGPLVLDASAQEWGEAERAAPWDALFSANMIHIAPPAAAEGLIAAAGRLLRPDGLLILYGPFSRAGVIAPSNAAFDESLKSRNQSWGVRDLDVDLTPLARRAGLALSDLAEMPANNLLVVFRKTLA